jgi:acyl transferase domain-containing protein
MGSTGPAWASEPIAIIGIGCKFAGDASNPSGLWELLAKGKSAWSEIPASRFNPKGAYHPNNEKLSTVGCLSLMDRKLLLNVTTRCM